MSHHKTAEEVRYKHLSILGPTLGRLYDRLYNDLVWLHIQWAQHRLLYGTKSSRIDLLNRSAPLFFRIVQDVTFEQTLLRISSLTDPPRVAGHATLSIRALPKAVSHIALRATVIACVEDAVTKAKFARDWRNRRIAHRSLDLALERPVAPLLAASREKVEAALEAIAEVLNAIGRHYLGTETTFRDLGQPGDARQLIYVLRDGVRVEQIRHERLARGEWRPEDLESESPNYVAP